MKIGDFGITQRAEEFDTAISLIVPMLHEQPTTRPEAIVRTHGNLPDAGEPVRAADQGEARFEAHVASFQMSVSRGDVRRIRRDHVEGLRSERIKPVAENKFDFGSVVPRVPLREGEGCLGNIRGDDPKLGSLGSKSDGNRSAARSELQHPRRRTGRKALERKLDEELGFRAGDQDFRPSARP